MARIRVTLPAYKRVEATRDIDVPDDATPGQIEEIARRLHDTLQDSDYRPDPEYFEPGEPTWQEVTPCPS